MNIDADGDKECENKGNQDGVLGEIQRFAQVGELKVGVADQSDRHGASSGYQHSSSVQVHSQQKKQRKVVCWETFLNVRSIRVLLVENDDCTRHVVTALLRNCHYEVIEAANAAQAWKILEDLNNHIDIVLTEVVMPCITGVALLCKIMGHKTRKNIPVIMMSTHDAMGLVFKCLSKGAVDFLVKPIRKNELKNLWQHVWRRCHSSSGSGSESGTQTQKSVKSKASEESGNSASDDWQNNDASNGLTVGDGSDAGSGSESSWTKQAVEVDSSQGLSAMDQVPECQDSTCAQVISSNAEYSEDNKLQISGARERHGQKQPEMCKRLDSTVNQNVELKSENLVGGGINLTDKECESAREVGNKLDINSKSTDEYNEPTLEVSLKRVREEQKSGRSDQDDRFVVRRSEQSAFSRYNTSTNAFKVPNVVTGSNFGNSIEVAKREPVGDTQLCSAEHMMYHSSNGVSNNIDMGSTTNKLKEKSEATSSLNGAYPSAFWPVKNHIRHGQQQSDLLPNDTQCTDVCPVRRSQQEVQIQLPHLQNYHHHRHFHSVEKQPSSLKKLAAKSPHCGSTNVLGGPVDGNLMNCSLNRSNSGSNHGSNGQNGSSTGINTVGNNAESAVGQAGKSGTGSGDGDASGSGTGTRVDENKLAKRQAALLNFRQKKKKICFKRGVRYQKRKKLAEQRPRIRGQFVKKAGTFGSS